MKLEEIREERNNKIARLLRYFGVIMAIFYFVLGISFMVMPWFDYLEGIRYAIGIMLIIYGCFRFYRLMKNQTQTGTMIDKEETQE